MPPQTLALGDRYPGTPPKGLPDGAVILDWTAARPLTLILALSMPTKAEIDAARNGKVRIGVRAPRPAIPGRPAQPPLLLYEIPRLADGDAPFELELLPEADRPDLTPLRAGQRYLLTILLLSAESGTVRAIRMVSLSERASRAWRAAVAGETAGMAGDCALGRAGE
jgi:hypothetical protein